MENKKTSDYLQGNNSLIRELDYLEWIEKGDFTAEQKLVLRILAGQLFEIAKEFNNINEKGGTLQDGTKSDS